MSGTLTMTPCSKRFSEDGFLPEFRATMNEPYWDAAVTILFNKSILQAIMGRTSAVVYFLCLLKSLGLCWYWTVDVLRRPAVQLQLSCFRMQPLKKSSMQQPMMLSNDQRLRAGFQPRHASGGTCCCGFWNWIPRAYPNWTEGEAQHDLTDVAFC